MDKKLIIDCSTNEFEEINLTEEEIAQRQEELNKPQPIQPPTIEERLESAEQALMALIGV